MIKIFFVYKIVLIIIIVSKLSPFCREIEKRSDKISSVSFLHPASVCSHYSRSHLGNPLRR